MQQDLGFWLCTLCIIIIIGGVVWNYVKMSSLWTPTVKRAFLYLTLLGILPCLITGWFFLLGVGYTREFTVAIFYCTGFSCILLRKYALSFLQELSKMPKYPHSKYHLYILNEIKQNKILYLVFTIYFFLMGTASLYILK